MGNRFDTIFHRSKLKKPKKIAKKKLSFWPFLLLGLILVSIISFIFVGKITAQYVLNSLKPASLFKDGKYLVLFQNNAELRSSGGFIGSFAVVEIQNYEVKNINFETNILALDRTYEENNYVEAPAPMKKFLKGKSWSLKDSNYDASFPDAAKDITRFYEQETSNKIDGVVATNASLMIKLLALTGPIKMDKYGVTINADNFYDVTQYQVEKGYFENPENWVINEPKTFLKELYPEIMAKAMNNKIGLYNLIKNELDDGEILFYFKDAQKEAIALEQNWTSEIKNTNSDYLYINSNSYSGDKSSIKITETIDYKVRENNLGQLVGNLKITKIHNGSFTWPDGANDTWTRIYTPSGTNFIKYALNGKDIPENEITKSSEYNKNVLGYKIFTNPGDVTIFELEYILPIKKENYQLIVQKQPGTKSEITIMAFNQLLYTGMFDRELNLEISK